MYFIKINAISIHDFESHGYMAIYKQSTTNISQLYEYSLDMWQSFGKNKPNGWEMNYTQQTKIGIIDDGKVKILFDDDEYDHSDQDDSNYINKDEETGHYILGEIFNEEYFDPESEFEEFTVYHDDTKLTELIACYKYEEACEYRPE